MSDRSPRTDLGILRWRIHEVTTYYDAYEVEALSAEEAKGKPRDQNPTSSWSESEIVDVRQVEP